MRWGWILLGGLLSEAAVFAYYIPVGLLVVGPDFFTPENAAAARPLIRTLLGVAPIAAFLTVFLLGRRNFHSRYVLHGALVGVVCVALSPQRADMLYIAINASKLVGAVLGGFVLQSRARKQPVNPFPMRQPS